MHILFITTSSKGIHKLFMYFFHIFKYLFV
nr:MAG TPA: hypothetical protein [Caudoviricetes sp.]